MDSPAGAKGRGTQGSQPPPGYPNGGSNAAQTGKKQCYHGTKKRGAPNGCIAFIIRKIVCCFCEDYCGGDEDNTAENTAEMNKL